MERPGTGPVPKKRKEPPTPAATAASNPNHNHKRSRQQDARAIATQPTSAAFPTGELDVAKFVKARQFEIQALERSLKNSKKALSQRAFQDVPRDLRRRTASHNVKRVPKRLRSRVAKEMAEDNTPTVTARRREKSGKMRLRMEIARRLLNVGEKVKARQEKKKKAVLNEDITVSKMDIDGADAESHCTTPVVARKPKVKKATLKRPPVPPAKFRKRQIHKTWLPTHMFHAKRAHLTPPKEPLWRFAVPLTSTMKSYRPTHRATRERGAVTWDMSYMSTIGLEGFESSIKGLLKAIGVGAESPDRFWEQKPIKRWLSGTRVLDTWAYRRQYWPRKAIAPVTIIWCARCREQGQMEPGSSLNLTRERRKAFIRVHPASFLELWEELLQLSTVQKPAVTVEDLRFEIGSINITGPGSTEALVSALCPWTPDNDQEYPEDSPEKVWKSLAPLTNLASLPANALLGYNICDPRLLFPPRTIPLPQDPQSDHNLLKLLTEWPVDKTQSEPCLFDRQARLTASRLLSSQKNINRRKGLALPGTYPEAQPSDPQIPVIVYNTTRSGTTQPGWWVLLPWKCVLPVWNSIMYYPLSTGGNPQLGGLTEIRQVAYEAGLPWFPGDYPGTKAGDAWEEMERRKRRDDWERHPKGKRVEYSTLDLGRSKKGEIGAGWACDWDLLLSTDPDIMEKDANDNQAISRIPSDVVKHLVSANAELNHKEFDNTLFAVKITLLARGVPTACARIYRLPTTDDRLREKWLSLVDATEAKNLSSKKQNLPPKPPLDAPPHILRQYLAESLLVPQPQPNEENYPIVPDEIDLIGFVTTGNFNLGEGRATAIGSLAFGKVVELYGGNGGDGKKEDRKNHLVIVRSAGQKIGRLARWTLI